MGKRSEFKRVARDAYDTPPGVVVPLIPFLRHGAMFSEPCAGNGSLIRALHVHGFQCQDAMDIEPRDWEIRRGDALADDLGHPEQFITNSPWHRKILHPLIERLSDIAPAWLLFDADWVHTKQAIPYLPRLRCIVSVGRVIWIPGTKMTGKDNCAWHLFTRPSDEPTVFHGRSA